MIQNKKTTEKQTFFFFIPNHQRYKYETTKWRKNKTEQKQQTDNEWELKCMIYGCIC